MRLEIKLFEIVGEIAENKDKARDIRQKVVMEELKSDRSVILNFDNVKSTTQSFVHALISDAFKEYGTAALDKIEFKNSNDSIKSIIGTVINYSISEE